MATDVRDTITDWSLGVVTSGEPDRQDLRNALIRADNAMFTKIAARVATIRKRHGTTLVNSTPFAAFSASEGPAIVGGEAYLYDNAGTEVRYTVGATADGKLVFFTDDGSSTNHMATTTTGAILNTDIDAPDFAVMNNRFFALDGKGAMVSFLGTDQTRWGVNSGSVTAAVAGAAGSMSGDYDVAITFYDAVTGAESELSEPFSVTGLASKKLDITVADYGAAVDDLYIRVYIRKPAEGPGMYRVLAGTGYTGGEIMGWAAASGSTTSITVDVDDATLEGLILTPPTQGSRGLPPSGVKYIAVHNNRLFVADDTTVYWSEQDLPDAFNPLNSEPLRSPKGGYVRGLATVPIDDQTAVLSVWTTTARHELSGTVDPSTWSWAVPDPELGLSSHRSIVVHDGLLFWWSPRHGPVMRTVSGGEIVHIGNQLVKADTGPAETNPIYARLISGVGNDGRVVWAVPDPQQSRLTRMVSFNTEIRRWESTKWDPMDAACLFVSHTTSEASQIVMGNYNGQMFRLLKGTNDGVRSGTTQGTFVAESDNIAAITDLSASFDTTGAGLIERKVTLLGPDGLVHGEVRPHITENTATSVMLSESITGLTPGATYTYLIGGQNFSIETYWWNFNEPFKNKRYDFLYLQFRADSGVSQVIINTAFSFDPLNAVETTSLDFTSEHWDTAFWDVANWDSVAVLNRKIGLLKVGTNARVQLRNPYPDQGFEVTKISMIGRLLNDAF